MSSCFRKCMVVLLAVAVSVVWSTAHATYILNDDIGFDILDSTKLHEYHTPLFHSNLPIHFDDHSHEISIPHVAAVGIQIINEPIHHLHNIGESGFNIPNVQHINAKHYSHLPKIEHNSQNHKTHQIIQQKLEITSPNAGYSIPQHDNQPLYQNYQNERHFSDLVFKHNSNLGNGYNHNSGEIHPHQYNNQNKDAEKSHQTSVYDVNQQKVVDIDFSKSVEPKLEQKAISEDSNKNEDKNQPPTYNEEQDKKSHTFYQTKDQNSKNIYNESSYDFKHNGNFHPPIYSQIPLIPAHYIKLHEGNVDSYSELPSNLGQISPIYRDIDIIKHQSGLSSHEGIKISPHIPILVSNNFQKNLGNQAEYLFELKDHGGFSSLGGYDPYYLLSNNGSQTDSSNFPKHLNQEIHNSNSNLEKNPASEEYKSDQEKSTVYNVEDNLPEYKEQDKINVPENKNDAKVADSYSEQKTLEDGYKEQSTEQTDSYTTVSEKEKKYNEQKSLDVDKYLGISSKNSPYNIEQKALEVKSSSPKVDYASDGSDGKGSEEDIQQKSVDEDFKSDFDKYDFKSEKSFGSDHSKLRNTGTAKYPVNDSKKSDQKLEQKSVETETYKALKAFFKPSDDTKDSVGSSDKAYSDNIRSTISNLKKDIDPKILNYETPSYTARANHGHPNRGSSSSYFNSHHPQNIKNGFNYGKKSDFVPYSNGGYHNKHTFTGNTYGGQGTSFSKYPNSFGNVFNHNNPDSSYTHTSASGLNYNRPYASQKPSTTENHGYSQHNSPYAGIIKSPTHSGFSGHASISHVPIYHERSHSGVSTPIQDKNSEPYNNHKFVKVTYEYPHHSVRKDEPIYAFSRKPISDYKKTFTNSDTYHSIRNHQSSFPEHPILKSRSHSSAISSNNTPGKNENYHKKSNEAPAASHSSYPHRDVNEQSIDDSEYSTGIESVEYPGIGEKPPLVVPKHESKQHSKHHNTEPSITEQKSHENDESIPTYSESSDIIKSSENEYKGIGEIGSIPPRKNEIVGGRHPIKRPTKNYSVKTKSVPSKAKGQDDYKTEQKYLPITATLSEKMPDSKKHDDSIKTEIPEKMEQQELTYEALLGEQGSPNHATGTSGYGFNPPVPFRGFPYLRDSAESDPEDAPMPYEFHYDIQDDEHGSEQFRREKMDDNGHLTGSYGYKNKEGIFREVEYEASKDGFKVNSIKTNEPGTDNEDPADVHIEVQKTSEEN